MGGGEGNAPRTKGRGRQALEPEPERSHVGKEPIMTSSKAKPPMGYVHGRTGRWLMDPRPRARKTIRMIVDTCRRLGSASAFRGKLQRRLTTNSRTNKLAVLYLRTAIKTTDAETTTRTLTA